MQCKNIPTPPILEFIDNVENNTDFHWANWFNIDGDYENPNSIRHAMPKNIPEKLILAKMRQLIKNKLVDGCGCGCRGDFVLTQKGREEILRHKNNLNGANG